MTRIFLALSVLLGLGRWLRMLGLCLGQVSLPTGSLTQPLRLAVHPIPQSHWVSELCGLEVHLHAQRGREDLLQLVHSLPVRVR